MKLLLPVAAIALGGTWLLGSGSTAKAEPIATCAGYEATIVVAKASTTTYGTDGDDVILGTPGNDIIDGRGGNDIICGGDGNDRLIGSAGDDVIYGNAGNDTLYGNAGNDTLFGGGGNDLLFGDAGDDFLSGDYFGAGDLEDTIEDLYAIRDTNSAFVRGLLLAALVNNFPDESELADDGSLPGNDTLRGGNDNDIQVGGLGDDDLRGENGEDTLLDFGGSDRLRGGPQNDAIFAVLGLAPDIDGEHGDDTIIAIVNGDEESGPLTLKGGLGNDVLAALVAGGDVRLDGGYGDDALLALLVEGDAYLDGGSGNNDSCSASLVGGDIDTIRCE